MVIHVKKKYNHRRGGPLITRISRRENIKSKCCVMKRKFKQFHQYQQNEQSPLTSNN